MMRLSMGQMAPAAPWWPVYWAMPAALGALLAMMLGLRVYQRRVHPNPEITRKLLHMGMGLVVLSFPWLFAEAWPVFTLAGVAVCLLVATRFLKPFRGLGDITAVPRVSLGDLYFPIAVAVLFALAHKQPLFYAIPLMILTLADALAALIGLRYGALHYQAADGDKTVEGSLAFFAVAFLAAYVPLRVLTDTPHVAALLIALILGTIVMLAEAIAWRGLDNLFIPLLSFFLLRIYLRLSVRELVLRLVVTASLGVLVYLLRRRTTLTHSALMGAVLLGYAVWALAGWIWLLPPLALFIVHLVAWPRTEANTDRHDIHVVIAVATPGLLWLFLYAHFGDPHLLFPFTVNFAAHLAAISVSWHKATPWSGRKCLLVARSAAGGFLLGLLPVAAAISAPHFGYQLGADPRGDLATFVVVMLLAVGVAAFLFAAILPFLLDPRTNRYRQVHRIAGGCALLASGLTYGPWVV